MEAKYGYDKKAFPLRGRGTASAVDEGWWPLRGGLITCFARSYIVPLVQLYCPSGSYIAPAALTDEGLVLSICKRRKQK